MLYLGLYVHSVIDLCCSSLFTSTSSKHFISAFGCDSSNPCGHVGSGILVQVAQNLGEWCCIFNFLELYDLLARRDPLEG